MMKKRVLAIFLACCMLIAMLPMAVQAEGTNHGFRRLYGSNRCATAYAIADELKAALGIEKFDAVLIANSNAFADALGGSCLAAQKNAPILLYREGYEEDNLAYIQKNLKADGIVYILGGTMAVPQEMEDLLEGFNVKRLYGNNRYITNLEIMKEAGITGGEILVATAFDFADSMSASATGKPILLVNNTTGKLTDEQKEFLSTLENAEFCIIGGTSAVSQKLADALSAYGSVSRVYGDCRETTSVAVANQYFDDPECIFVAYSRNFPDSLCGGPLARVLGAPLLLTNAGKESVAAAYVSENGVTEGIVLGGTAAVSDHSLEIIMPIEKPVSGVTLRSSETELSINDDGTVYFYAEVASAVPGISLIDEATGEVVMELLDDGKYSVSGDDLPGDNVYSGVTVIDTTEEASFSYHAVVEGEDGLVSESVQIRIVSGFTEEELDGMEAVDLSIQDDIFSAAGFEDMPVEERSELAETVLDSLVEQSLIDEETVLYNEDSFTYTFMYESGALGAVILKEWEDDYDGVDGDRSERKPIVTDDSSEETSALNADGTAPAQLGEAIVLWSFEQAWDDPDFRVPFYQTLESDFDALGLETTVDWDVTVNDYKNLHNYEVIMFSGHGAYTDYVVWTGPFSKETRTLPSLLLYEESTRSKDKTYENDLNQFRVGKISVQGGTMYAILPEFFADYYDSGDLEGSFVFIQDCESHGKDGNENYLFANALINASAEAVVGYHNSVISVYGRNFMKTYVERLIAGDTARKAFDAARAKHGNNDGDIAYPIFSGDSNAVLVHEGIQNGDFEEASTAVHWGQVGDTRIISQLGSLTPVHDKRMAILTTGIGSAEEDYLAGTEGSVLSQTFRIPENASTLTFSFDVVSEEPSEFVGSEFNDAFIVKLIVGDEIYTLATEDINNSVWYEISGIDFDGGDETTYHTDWKTKTVDISTFAGKTVTLQFIVYDVGDSIYDTAALIDYVRIN